MARPRTGLQCVTSITLVSTFYVSPQCYKRSRTRHVTPVELCNGLVICGKSATTLTHPRNLRTSLARSEHQAQISYIPRITTHMSFMGGSRSAFEPRPSIAVTCKVCTHYFLLLLCFSWMCTIRRNKKDMRLRPFAES